MEGAPHRGHGLEIGGIGTQARQAFPGLFKHLARFLQEDLAHVVVVLAHGCRCRHGGRGRRGRGQGGQRLDHVRPRRLLGRGVLGLGQGLAGLAHHLGHLGLIGRHGLVGQAFQVTMQVFGRNLFLLGTAGQCLHLVQQSGLHFRRFGGRLGTPHQGGKAARGGIETEQGLGQLGLHAQHVDQEGQGPQVVGQLVGRTGSIGVLRQHGSHVVAHALDGLRGLIQPQHRQHAAHGVELVGHRRERLALVRVAVETVELLLDLGQGGAQLLHHAAHGLTVRHIAVQGLDPGLQRRRRPPGRDHLQTLRHLLDAILQIGMLRVGLVQRGIQAQQRGGHFHRQLGRGTAPGLHGALGRGLQGLGQALAVLVDLANRLAHLGRLFMQAGQRGQFTSGHQRPALLERRHTTPCLGHQGRVVAAQRAALVIGTVQGRQLAQARHLGQTRRMGIVAAGAGAEEQQILQQTVRAVLHTPLHRPQLHQQARSQTLGQQIRRQQTLGLRLEEARRQAPGQAQTSLGTLAQLGEGIAHATGRRHIAPQVLQQTGFDRLTHAGIGCDHGHRGRRRQRRKSFPEVGGMDALRTGQGHDLTVLREQAQFGGRPPGQLPAEKIQHRKGCLLDRFDWGGLASQLTAVDALDDLLAGAQHARGADLSDQLQGAHALVDQIAGLLQCRMRRRSGHFGRLQLLVAQLPTQGLVRVVERPAQFILNPGECAQVSRQFLIVS